MNQKEIPLLVTAPALPAGYAAIPHHYAHPGLSLAQLLAIVAAYWRITVGVTLATMLLTGIVSKLLPKTYEATATVMVDYNVSDPIAGKEFPVSLMGSYMSTQTQLLKSPAVLLPVIEKLRLTENKRYAKGFEGDPRHLPEWIRGKMIKKLAVEQGNWGSQLISITYAATSAQEAAEIANAIAELYTEQQALRLTGPSSERAKRFTDQLEELELRVDKAQDQLTGFRQKAGLIDNETKVDIELGRLTELEHRLIAAQAERRMLEAQNLGSASSDAVLGSGSVQTLKTQLATQQARMAELSAVLGPRHPEVQQLQQQIAVTRRALGAEMGAYSSNAGSRVSAARSVERELQKAVDAERVKVQDKRRVQDESSKYVMELETAQTLYKQALENYDSIVLTSGGGYNNVRLISHATPPAKASKPKTLVNVALALLAGGFLGVVGPLFYELLNRRVRCRDDLDRDFNLPVLMEFGSLPAEIGAK